MKTYPLSNSAPDKDSELFAMLFLLDSQGYIYYDSDDDADVLAVRKHLDSIKAQYSMGQNNRKFLTTIH